MTCTPYGVLSWQHSTSTTTTTVERQLRTFFNFSFTWTWNTYLIFYSYDTSCLRSASMQYWVMTFGRYQHREAAKQVTQREKQSLYLVDTEQILVASKSDKWILSRIRSLVQQEYHWHKQFTWNKTANLVSITPIYDHRHSTKWWWFIHIWEQEPLAEKRPKQQIFIPPT